MTEVRRLDRAEHPQVIGAVARAFYDDPVSSWMFPRADRRREQIERIYGVLGERFWLADGESFTTADLQGGSFWMPPAKTRASLLDQVALTPRMLQVCGRDFARGFRMILAMDRSHPHEDHWYLAVMGVHPDRQGRGYGTSLLRPMLDRCDEQGLPAYLEASSRRNRALYERNGFEVTGEIRVGDSPPLWPMRREPR